MGAHETAADLDRKFGVPGVARVVEGNGRLPKVAVTAGNASGEMYLLGAEVTSWKPQGAEEVLFVSAASKWADGKAIRGGVPICCPWFGNKAGDPKAPAHGFVRAKAWQLESIEKNGGDVTISMATAGDAETRKLWPSDFRLVQRATFGSVLVMELEMTNTGQSSFRFEAALHTYFRVGDIAQVRIRGLDGIRYLDKTDGNREKLQKGELTIGTETDSVYLDTAHTVDLIDGALRRTIEVSKENSRSTVVWNPWIVKSKAMADLGDDEWKQFACVETCNVAGHAIELAPGQKHSMKAIIRTSRS